jgi:hypothetical protein
MPSSAAPAPTRPPPTKSRRVISESLFLESDIPISPDTGHDRSPRQTDGEQADLDDWSNPACQLDRVAPSPHRIQTYCVLRNNLTPW